MAVLTMRCETVAVGCHRLRIGLFERFSSASYLPPVAPAGLHKCSIHSPATADGQWASGVQPSARRVLSRFP